MNFVKIVLSVLNLLKGYFPLHIPKGISEVMIMWHSKNFIIIIIRSL